MIPKLDKVPALAGLATMVLAVTAAPAVAAKDGSAPAASVCQKGGWETVVRGNGSGFTSVGACVSYAARGGLLQPRATAQTVCESAGSTFTTGTSGVSYHFLCAGPASWDVADRLYEDLSRLCHELGGSLRQMRDGATGDTLTTCDRRS